MSLIERFLGALGSFTRRPVFSVKGRVNLSLPSEPRTSVSGQNPNPTQYRKYWDQIPLAKGIGVPRWNLMDIHTFDHPFFKLFDQRTEQPAISASREFLQWPTFVVRRGPSKSLCENLDQQTCTAYSVTTTPIPRTHTVQ